jgi:hypothetical protein
LEELKNVLRVANVHVIIVIVGANVLVNVVVLVIKNVLEIADVYAINVCLVEKDIVKEEVKNVL